MHQDYHDITSRLGSPVWFDECGVPRYDPFAPGMCNDIYADEAVLLEIACQRCGARFHVSDTNRWGPSIREAIVDKAIHYGDPPHHDCIGDTMNCEDLQVLEYWYRDQSTQHAWTRDRTLEIVLQEEAPEGVMPKPTLLLDFDGVLSDYHAGWQGPNKLGAPVPGAVDFVRRAVQVFDVVVFSSRARYEEMLLAMRAWLARHGFPPMPVTATKPPAFLTLDDRALLFTGVWPQPEDLLRFRAWYEEEA